MKRQKRSTHERAYHRGYQAGISGRHQDHCPHEQGDSRQQWLAGWREGRSDNWDGLTGVSGLHKAQIG